MNELSRMITRHRPSKKRVLILSTGAGTGHLKAAEAIEKACLANEGIGEVVHQDALQYTNKLFRDFYSKLYTQLVQNAPDFLGWWYKTSDEPWRTDGMRLAFDRLNTGPLVRLMKEFEPDFTICTHFMPAGIMAHLIEQKKLQSHLSIVVTDFDFHAMWLSRTFHQYFVAIEETKAHLEALGLPGDHITVSGIPIDAAFGEEADRRTLKEQRGFDPDIPVLLVSAGALSVSPMDYLLEHLLKMRNRVQLVVICGKNEELLEDVKEIAKDRSGIEVLGYTREMPVLMKMADLFIGKPGGLTTSEALACGLPMVVVSPIPGQEERNSDHLLENGVAIKCNTFVTLAFKVDRLLDQPERLASMRRNAKALGRPNAAKMIVETLLNDHLAPVELEEEEIEAMSDLSSGKESKEAKKSADRKASKTEA